MTEPTDRAVLQHSWDVLIVGAALALAFVIPLRLVSSPSQQALSGAWESLVTLLFSIDFLVRRWPGGRVSRVQSRRSASAWVAVDVLAALPLGPMLQLPAAGLLRLTKLLRIIPLSSGLRRSVAVHPTILRLAVFLFWLTISAHWLACGWIFLEGPVSTANAPHPCLQGPTPGRPQGARTSGWRRSSRRGPAPPTRARFRTRGVRLRSSHSQPR